MSDSSSQTFALGTAPSTAGTFALCWGHQPTLFGAFAPEQYPVTITAAITLVDP
jgi:hypothetical protein